MDEHFYYSSLRNTTAQFLNLFNGISVVKYNSKGKAVKEQLVPLKYSTKEKFYYWIHDLKHESILPCMAVSLQSLEFDQTRKGNSSFNIMRSSSNETSGQKILQGVRSICNPAPYIVGYQLNVACELMVELDQILEQILPYFDPFNMVRIKMDELDDFEFDVKVVFSGLSFEISQEIDEVSHRLVNATLDFSAHTYLFKPSREVGLVSKINVPMYARKDLEDIPSSRGITINENKTFKSPYSVKDSPHEILGINGTIGRNIDEILVEYELYKNEDQRDD